MPDVRAEAAIIYNPENGKVLWESNSQNQRSIASITKVMTAVVFLENDPGPDRSRSSSTRSDVRAASTTYLRAGYTVTEERSAAPDADRVGQRRGPRAGAHLARTAPKGSCAA